LLCTQGVALRIPTRRRELAKSELIVLPNTEVIEANIDDAEVLARLVAGCEAVVNLVGILHEKSKGDFRRVHAELPRKIVDACRTKGVPRLVHVSALNAAHDASSEYLRSKAAGEQQIRAAQPSGVQTTIFRPSVIFGRDDAFLNLFARLARLSPVIPLGCPNARFQPIYVDDVARAIATCLGKPQTFARTFKLCGPKTYRLQELVSYACSIRGLRRLIIPLSPGMTQLQAFFLEHLPGKLMTRDNVRSMQVDSVCGCAFPEALGFDPSAMEAVAPLYLAKNAQASRLNRYRIRANR
jgi:NADH dehydrogenase